MILISQAIFDTQMKTTFAGYLQIQDDKIVAIGPLSALPVDEEVIDRRRPDRRARLLDHGEGWFAQASA